MKAMVFAAGQGLRLRPLTEKTPKALVPVAGRAMIEYPLLLLRHYGIRDIIINLHHLGEQIVAYLGDGSKLGLKIRYSQEETLLDTGGGLLKAMPFLQDGTFIVINNDVVIDLPLAELIAFHRHNKAMATLVLRRDELADQYGSMEIDADGRLNRFLQAKRPGPSSSTGVQLMFTGVQVLEPSVFNHMRTGGTARKFSTTQDTYPALLRKNEALYGFGFDGYWQDLGTLERLRDAEKKITQGKVRLHYL